MCCMCAAPLPLTAASLYFVRRRMRHTLQHAWACLDGILNTTTCHFVSCYTCITLRQDNPFNYTLHLRAQVIKCNDQDGPWGKDEDA